MVFLISLATALRFISLGGAIYEVGLVDPVWPARPEFIRPRDGGIARGRFWIPVHVAYELSLIAALIVSWPHQTVRWYLVAAFAFHAVMRAWSGLRFIPQALRFERGDPSLGAADAARWVRGSRLRLPLDVASAVAVLCALVDAARL